ncbi:TNF superfamily member 9 [Rhinolophus ferrumequinum]|uniref:TNF superfamily member 9 n=1 Tax=Rhinolophus ferrumequinum TaxID=59479 RepID=A0A671F779_RHIFE|nr:tumor necrosis factor ligand superfamily member 9 [Rhinolophus ferrumequinum]KAF6307342.1 TNF superfamily member 9 [Rhinolophus ferrumequinum]
MPSSSDAVPDPEAARPPAPRGHACHLLPWVLSAALLLLASVCAVCAVRVWALTQWPASPGPSLAPSWRLPEVPDARAGLGDSPQGMGVFAQLVARDALLTEGLLHWYSNPGLKGVFLAPGVSYDERTRELVVDEAGIYYVFLHLELRRVVASAGSGWVSIALHLQPLGAGAEALALTLNLPPLSSEARDSVAGFRGGLMHLGAGQRLGVRLSAEAAARLAWQLAQGATVLGLYRVATKVPAALPSPQPS